MFEAVAAAEERHVKRGHLNQIDVKTCGARAGRVSLREGMAEVTALRVGVALDERDSPTHSGHVKTVSIVRAMTGNSRRQRLCSVTLRRED